MCCICELSQNDRNLILVDFDLLVVHLVERVAFLGTSVFTASFSLFPSIFT